MQSKRALAIWSFMFSGCCGLVGGKIGETGGKGRKDCKEQAGKRHKVSDLLCSVPINNCRAFLVFHCFRSIKNSGRVTGSLVVSKLAQENSL